MSISRWMDKEDVVHTHIHTMEYSVQFSSFAQSCLTLCNPMNCSMDNITNSRSSLKLTSIESVMPSSHLILCPPLLLLPPVSPSIRVFFTWGGQNTGVSALASFLPKNTQGWSPSEWTGWLDLLAVQGTLKSLLQHHSSKASILRHSTFFIVQLSHPFMTIGKP